MKTINRGWLKRQVAAGKMEARCAYRYTDDYASDAATNDGKTDWKPARLCPQWEKPDPAFLAFEEHAFGYSTGRAFECDAEPGIVRFHPAGMSECYQLRMREATR